MPNFDDLFERQWTGFWANNYLLPVDSCPQNSATEVMLTFVICKINITSFFIKVVHSSKFFWIEKRFWFRVILFRMTLETWLFPCSLVQVDNFQKVSFLKVSCSQNAFFCLKFSKKPTQKFDEFLPWNLKSG